MGRLTVNVLSPAADIAQRCQPDWYPQCMFSCEPLMCEIRHLVCKHSIMGEDRMLEKAAGKNERSLGLSLTRKNLASQAQGNLRRSRLRLRYISPAGDRRINPVIARHRSKHGSSSGKFRWMVDGLTRGSATSQRLWICFNRCSDIHEAFFKFACSLVCGNIFKRAESHF